MRLSDKEVNSILEAIKKQDPTSKVHLFGSRIDDSKNGGDIDLLIESKTIKFIEKQKIRLDIQNLIGDQKIDLVVSKDFETEVDPFILKILKGSILL